MRIGTPSIVLIGLLLLGCGGAASNVSTSGGDEGSGGSISLADDSGHVDGRAFDHFSSVFFNDSVEEIGLRGFERAAMENIGLDPNDEEDYQLLSFVVRGFHYRYYAHEEDGDRSDLGVYVYNLDRVRVGEPVQVLDLSPLEGLASDEIGGTLHDLFDPIRESGEPRAIVAYAKSRANEPSWRRIFINAFAEDVEFATSGSFRITRALDHGGAEIDLVTHPGRLSGLDFSFRGEHLGHPWRVDQRSVPLRLSGS